MNIHDELQKERTYVVKGLKESYRPNQKQYWTGRLDDIDKAIQIAKTVFANVKIGEQS